MANESAVGRTRLLGGFANFSELKKKNQQREKKPPEHRMNEGKVFVEESCCRAIRQRKCARKATGLFCFVYHAELLYDFEKVEDSFVRRSEATTTANICQK